MTRVLVTGADGQLGRSLRDVAGSGAEYIFTDLAQLDITDADAISRFVKDNNIDVIVNCAAYTDVEKAEDERAQADAINHHAVAAIAGVCTETGAAMIHISTDYVFPGDGNRPLREEADTAPLNYYGQSKLRGENAVRLAGCDYLLLRTSWLYSQYGGNFVKTMLRLTAERDKLQVVCDQTGTPTFARDLAAAICHIVENGLYAGRKEVLHFSNEGVCSWYDLAVAAARMAGRKCDIEPVLSGQYPTKAARPAYTVLDKARYKAFSGRTIPHWEESLAECVAILEKQQ